MNGITTITSKGQVVIPKSIRDQFGLKPASKVQFMVKDQTIFLRVQPSVRDIMGSLSTSRRLNRQQEKSAFAQAVIDDVQDK